MSYGFLERFGTLAIAAALLFVALRAHKSSKRWAKWTGVALSFLAGCAFLVTFVGAWMGSLSAKGAALFFVAGLIVCGAIIFFDLLDKKPDKPAFWATFALAFVMVFGVASVPKATGQIGDGASKVGAEFSKVTGPAPKQGR